MSGASSWHSVLLVVLILLVIGTGLLAGAGIPAIRTSRQKNQALIATRAEWQKSHRLLRSANDSVIAELEAHPATYETFPQDVREQLYAAHTAAASTDKNGR